jgi:opacity protein-like surface antigen
MDKIKLYSALVLTTAIIATSGNSYAIGEKNKWNITWGGLSYVIHEDQTKPVAPNDRNRDSNYGYLALGYRIYDRVHAEVEYARKVNDIVHNGTQYDVTSQSAMGNVIFEVIPGAVFNPYVGGGAGYTFFDKDQGGGGTLTYQGMAGVEINFVDWLALNVGYRYVGWQESKVKLGGDDYALGDARQSFDLAFKFRF